MVFLTGTLYILLSSVCLNPYNFAVFLSACFQSSTVQVFEHFVHLFTLYLHVSAPCEIFEAIQYPVQ